MRESFDALDLRSTPDRFEDELRHVVELQALHPSAPHAPELDWNHRRAPLSIGIDERRLDERHELAGTLADGPDELREGVRQMALARHPSTHERGATPSGSS